MSNIYYEGAPNQILGARRRIHFPESNKTKWGYVLRYEGNLHYRVLIEDTGACIRTKHILLFEDEIKVA